MTKQPTRPIITPIVKPFPALIAGSFDHASKLCVNTQYAAVRMINPKALNHWAIVLEADCPEWLRDPRQAWAPSIAMTMEDATQIIIRLECGYQDEHTATLLKGQVGSVFVHTRQIIRQHYQTKYDSEMAIAQTYLEEFLRTHEIPKPVPVELQIIELRKQVKSLEALVKSQFPPSSP